MYSQGASPLAMAGTQNKRKFDDSGSGVSYNRVPPPLSDFELAKQRAVQIAARLVAQDTKRSRLEDRIPDDSPAQHDDDTSEVHDSGQFFQNRGQEKAYSDVASGSFYNMHGPPESRKVEIPNAKVGLIIGKGGETIKYIQQQSGARIQITKDMDHNPNVPFRMVEMMGTPEQISRAEQLIQDVIAEADAAATNPSYAAHTSVGEQIQMSVPTNKVGLIIGRGGETIKSLQSRTGARIQLVPLPGPPEYHSGVSDRVLTLVGSKQQVDAASELIKELVSENRMRGPPIQGGYNQAYKPPQGPPQWGPPGGLPMQQQGYGYQQGYQQQGSFYTAPPQHYGSFPQHTPTGWSQPPPAPPPQFHPAGSYGYYNQQGQTGYSQQPHGGGYEQQASYVEQPPGATQEGYDQQVPGQPELYGQMGSHQTYGPPGMPPYGLPGVSSTTYTQGPSQEGYGPPGVGEPAYGQQVSGQQAIQQQLGAEQGPPGVGKPDYEHQQAHEARELSQQGYGQVGSENEKQSSEYSYDGANETSYGGQPGPGQHDASQEEQIASQLNYGQPGTGYWNHSSAQYSYSGGYEANQTSYGEQVPAQSGYGRQSVQPVYEQQQDGLQPPAKLSYGGQESSQHVHSMHGASLPSSGYQGPALTHPGEEHDRSQPNSPQEKYEREGIQNSQEQLRAADQLAYGNGYSYNGQYDSGYKGRAGNEGGDGQATTANAASTQARIDEDQEPQS